MQLNSIIPKENKQWLKMSIVVLIILFISTSIFVLYAFSYNQKMADLYVDVNYQGWLKWGSEKHPYENIHEALEAATRKKTRPIKIHLGSGKYIGSIEIPENMEIHGESREGVILKNNGIQPISIVEMKNNSIVSNLTVLGGITGILAEGKAVIENCSVRDFKKIGVDASASESEIIIKDCEISNSRGKAFYAQKGRKIQLIGNNIHDNKEEGLDLRQSVSGEIISNKIYNNEESGIESVVCGSYLRISKNEIWGNKSNGITFQYYEDEKKDAEIIIENNRISAADSEHFAISVANPSGEKNKPENFWRNSIKIYDDNILEGGIRKRSLEITKK